MTVKITLSFTDRHHGFPLRKVEEGVCATQSTAVAAAVEQMMQEEAERESALGAMADEIRSRLATPRDEFVDINDVFRDVEASLLNKR